MSKLVVKTDGLLETDDGDRGVLEQAGLRFAEGTYLTEDELIDNCRDTSGLLVLREPITERVLDALPNLEVVARFGVGLDSIDLQAAARHDVVVTNVPNANTHEVAAHAVTLATSLVRRIGEYDSEVRHGGWRFRLPGRSVRRLTSLTFGVLGLGQIGRQVATMASALGYQVQAYDPALSASDTLSAGVRVVDQTELVATSDVLSLHVPLVPKTRNLIDAALLARMQPGSILVNVSRGGIVDESALADALEAGHLGAAGLDVFEEEPLPDDNPLRACDNVILTPHAAHYSIESYAETRRTAFEEAARVLTGATARHRAI